LKWHAGYGFNRWTREQRDTETTDTNRLITGIDFLGADWVTFRAAYQYSHRSSEHFEVDVPVYLPLPLRRYDVANLNQNLFSANVDFIPSESTTLGLNAVVSHNNYPDSDYGVLKWNQWNLGADFGYAFKNNSSFNLWYEHGNIERDQRGRQSNSDGSPATSPTRDWLVSLLDRYDTFGVGYSIPFREGKCNWNTNANWSRANGSADFETGPAIRPTGAVDLSNVDDTDLYSVRTGIEVKVFPRARIGASYWFERYTIDDFAENAIRQNLILIPVPTSPIPATGGTITLNEIQPDYEFHSAWLGFMYSW
jgi:hypothetical protein